MPLILGAGENITYNTSPFYFYESNSNTSWFWLLADPYPALAFEFRNVGGTIWAGPWVNADAPTGMPWRNFASDLTWFDVVPNAPNGTGRILCSATQSWNSFVLLMDQNVNGRSTIDATYLAGSTNNILRMVMQTTEAARWGASDPGFANRGFFIGRTTSAFNGAEVLQVQSVGTSNPAAYFSLGTNPGASNYNLVWFGFYTGYSGAWVTNSSSSFLAGISDHRRKVNVQPMTEGMSVIGRLRPVIYNWKDNPEDTNTHGFLAHEMYEVLPEAVRGEPFEVNDEGQPVYQMIDRIPVVPWLTAAIKQMIDRMETIEQQLTDLEPGAVQ